MTATRPKRPLKVSAAKARRRFPHLLRAAKRGHVVTITRKGVKVAQLIGATRPKVDSENSKLAAMDKVMDVTKEGLSITDTDHRLARDEKHEE